MKALEITINRESQSVTTFGMKTMKGNVDGTVNFEEAGINNGMGNYEITEYFEEKYDDYDVTVLISSSYNY